MSTPTPRQMIDTLIGFDTTSRESNLELIHHVRDYLAGHGVESVLIHDDTGAKANLFATVGPDIDGGIVLSGHTDVVPVDGQDWFTDPFRVREADGRLYGRGTSDMKSFIAIALALVPEFLAAGLKKPVHFAFSYDEEIGCLGAKGLVSHIQGMTTKPRAVIVGEPSDMSVVNAHKTVTAVDTVIRGHEAHSSQSHAGISAVAYAGEFLHALNQMARKHRDEGPYNERFIPPFTSITPGTVRGGTARNIIAKDAKINWDIRAIPGVDVEEIVAELGAQMAPLVAEMQGFDPTCGIETRIINNVPALMADEGSDVEALVLALAGSNQTYAVAYGTEGGMFQQGGVPTVICGPGNIAQAHKPDEFIELSQVEACTGFMRRLADYLADAA